MSNRKDWWQKIAKVVCTTLHPGVVFVPVVAMVAYVATGTPREWGRWILLTLLLVGVFTIVYVRLRAGMLRRDGRSQISLRSIFRERPEELLVLAGLSGIPSSLVLYYIGCPDILLALVIATTGAMFVVALVNFVYRASFHLALVTSMLSTIWFIFGPVSLVTLALIFVLGLARNRLREHTLGELTSGFMTGLVVTIAVFRGMGLAF